MLKILQAKLQQYMKYEIPDVQSRLRKGRRTKQESLKDSDKYDGVVTHLEPDSL